MEFDKGYQHQVIQLQILDQRHRSWRSCSEFLVKLAFQTGQLKCLVECRHSVIPLHCVGLVWSSFHLQPSSMEEGSCECKGHYQPRLLPSFAVKLQGTEEIRYPQQFPRFQ